MRKKNLIIVSCLVIIFFISSCTNTVTVIENTDNGIVDNQKLYENDKINSVKEVYITVLPADSKNPEYSYTLTDLNTAAQEPSKINIKVRVIFQEGKNGGSQPGYFGYGLTSANGVMEQRGQSARLAEQKSYKIKLLKDGGLWNGFNEINLNKHPYDTIRIRNKLTFDYIKLIPDLTSCRTQFIHLFIKDLSEGDFNQEFEDYGLFTQIEDIDKKYLKAHGLDPKGSLYKAEYFEFHRYQDKLKLKNDPNYNKEEFEKILAIKGNDNHEKLINMLNDVNNRLIHINDVIDKHFDRENYLTWLALNILIDNKDTNSQNFYLYSPSKSNKWYFIPWDHDKGWINRRFKDNNSAFWQQGISTYWGVTLHRRFFENDDNVKELSEKIESLSQIMTQEKTKEFLDEYRPVIEYFLGREPDNKYVNLENVLPEFDSMVSVIEDSKKRYYKSLQNPMPVFMGEPQKIGHYYTFSWTESYDLQGDSISYSIEISDSPNFDTILYSENNIAETEHVVDGLNPGEYYWRLRIFDSKGNMQSAFDYYVTEENMWYFGIRKFIVH